MKDRLDRVLLFYYHHATENYKKKNSTGDFYLYTI